MTVSRMCAWSLAALALFVCFKVVGWWKNPWVPGSGSGVGLAVPALPSASAVFIPGCADKPGCKP
ncbi:MAG: hypothetical protein ABIQ16_17985 [Polyangiaceae bacterium]